MSKEQQSAGQPASPLWLRTLVLVMRLVVGGLFVFSGFVKAIDPWGTLYKFNDYFVALGLDGLTSISLAAAAAVAVVELMLGVAVLTGAFRRMAPALLVLLMLVFTPLTLWLAVTDAVPDCGCFGDAVKLSNWATFSKNLLLLAGLVFLLIYNKVLPSLFGPAVHWIVVSLAFVLAMALAYYGYFYQPLIDYRPYKTGVRLADDSQAGEDDFIFVYEKDGVEREFTIDSLPDEEQGWNYVNRRHARRGGEQPKASAADSVRAISVFEGLTDITQEVIDPQGTQLLFLFPDLPKVNIAYSFMLNELTDKALAEHADVVGLTSGTVQDIVRWNDVSMASYPVYNMDDSELKMLARGNPAVVMVDHGKVRWKRTLGSITREHLKQASIADLGNDYDRPAILRRLLWTYLALTLALLAINRLPKLVKAAVKRNKKQDITNPT